MNKQDEVNWSSCSIEHAGWNDLSELQQQVASEVWRGYNHPPIGLEEISAHEWWWYFNGIQYILTFTLFVVFDENGNRINGPGQHLTVWLDATGSGLAAEFKYYDAHGRPNYGNPVTYYRVGCHHNWIEISATMTGQHVDRCDVCGRVKGRDSSD